MRVSVVGTHKHTHPRGLICDISNTGITSLGANSGRIIREPSFWTLIHTFVVMGEVIRVSGADQDTSSSAIILVILVHTMVHTFTERGMLECICRANTDAAATIRKEGRVSWAQYW